MFDLEVVDFEDTPISFEASWGLKKYNFPVSYRLIIYPSENNSFRVEGNEGDVFPYTRNYFAFLITSETFLLPKNIKIKIFEIESRLEDLSFFMVSSHISEGNNQAYFEVYDLPTTVISLIVDIEDTIRVTEIEGFWKFDLENRDFSIYVESLPRDLRFMFC